jgi:N-methylhydantoinase B/oxoprolinase/acetone carboxylase alpha subunit
VITPEGTIVNARRPAPCGRMVELKNYAESAVMGALSQAIAGKVTGEIKGGGNHCYVGGPDPRTGATSSTSTPRALSVLAEKSLLRPYGVTSGASGAPNRFRVRRGGAMVEPSPVPGKVSGSEHGGLQDHGPSSGR